MMAAAEPMRAGILERVMVILLGVLGPEVTGPSLRARRSQVIAGPLPTPARVNPRGCAGALSGSPDGAAGAADDFGHGRSGTPDQESDETEARRALRGASR